jgi:hypothetical protein
VHILRTLSRFDLLGRLPHYPELGAEGGLTLDLGTGVYWAMDLGGRLIQDRRVEELLASCLTPCSPVFR